MTFVTVTQSSIGTSTPVALNWIGGKPATVQVISTNAGSSIFFNVQYTLDDVQRTLSSAVFWSNLSSAYSDTGVSVGAGSLFASSNTNPDGLLVSLLSPFAAVRLNSSSITNGPLIMKVVQGEGW